VSHTQMHASVYTPLSHTAAGAYALLIQIGTLIPALKHAAEDTGMPRPEASLSRSSQERVHVGQASFAFELQQ
jgi:hypothetical protein